MTEASRVARRLAAIVPAYNEERTIAAVIGVLQGARGIDEVIVVSDGSNDRTVEIARQLGATTYHLVRNHGKAAAMALGVARSDAELVLFVDGDILGIAPAMIESLIAPVRDGRVAMNVGIRSRMPGIDAFHRRFGPLLSGIRCLERQIFDAVPEHYVVGFRIETALNWACRRLGRRLDTTVLHGLRHLVKEKKRGPLRGAWARIVMFSSVFFAFLKLHVDEPALRAPSAPPRLHGKLEHVRF
jgi:glycosyltransferase involved in cell wall biosynthesis